jgi:uncharacterized protein
MFVLALTLAATLAAEPGNSQAFRIESAILGQTRRVLVHLPPSFAKSAATRRYPTIVAFDGDWMLRNLAKTSEVLVDEGQMPEAVIVAIENTDDFRGRVHDLTPPGLSVSGSGLENGGDRFLDFIEKELLPALDAKFRTAAPRTLVGTSSGGVLVTWAVATRDTFRLHLALDAPIHLGDRFLAKKLLERTKSSSKPMRYVSMDVRFGWPDDAWTGLVAAAPPTWTVHREKLTRESHTSMQFLGSYLGLRELFADFSMLAAPEYPTTSILPGYDKLAASYGAPLIPPAPLLRRVTEDLLMEGRGAAARAAFETLVTAYGEPRDAAKLRTQIAEVERRPPPAESVEGLLATPFPSPEEIRDYVGDWEGEQWIHPAEKNRFILRIAIENGKVVAKTIHLPEPGVELVQVTQYLKVTEDGLTWGHMNGMRPRGVLVHEGRREGDVLRGEVRFGGVNFVPPDGMKDHKHEFEVRKKRE